MSGNVIDLCPVGALTNKPNAFSARSWEYRSTPSVDVLDPCAPSIKVDTAKGEVMRVQPRTNELVNEEWISDKTRFAVDGLKRQRLDMPLLRGANGALAPCTWQDALAAAAGALEGAARGRVGVVAGPLVELEALVALKDLFNQMGSTTTHSSGSAIGSADLRANYTLNATIAGIEDADAILLVGTNPRVEAPLVNTRIRKMVRHANVRVGLVGPEQTDLSYEYEALGASVSDLANVSKSDFGKHLASAKRPLILVGAGALERVDGAAIGSLARSLAITSGCLTDGGWNGYSVLQRSAGATGALDIGFTPGPTAVPISEVEVLYLAGADEPLPASDKKPYVIYHGHHGDAGAAAGVSNIYPFSPDVTPHSPHISESNSILLPPQPTSSCPAPRTRKRPQRTFRPRGGLTAPRARSIRPARRARTGRSSSRSRMPSKRRCRTRRAAPCARASQRWRHTSSRAASVRSSRRPVRSRSSRSSSNPRGPPTPSTAAARPSRAP